MISEKPNRVVKKRGSIQYRLYCAKDSCSGRWEHRPTGSPRRELGRVPEMSPIGMGLPGCCIYHKLPSAIGWLLGTLTP